MERYITQAQASFSDYSESKCEEVRQCDCGSEAAMTAEFTYGLSEANPFYKGGNISPRPLRERVPEGRVRGKESAFTLAEVLITLGIIGVVAAMTMPSLIEKHQKKVVETRLKKFYSSINQAIRQSEVENGSYIYWEYPVAEDIETLKIFYDKYFAKYLKALSVDTMNKETLKDDGSASGEFYDYLVIVLSDGSAMTMRYNLEGLDITYYPNKSSVGQRSSRTSFDFAFNKKYSVGEKSFIEPYTYLWNGTREHLFSQTRYGCGKKVANTYCAKLIQYDGWKISDDYPW